MWLVEAAENLIGDKGDAYVVASSRLGHSPGSSLHIRRLQELSKQSSNILQNLRMRVWTSLMPTENFPLSAEDVKAIDPHSLTGKNFSRQQKMTCFSEEWCLTAKVTGSR